MTDRFCVRGCTTPGVHFATCPDYALGDAGSCKGCAPVEARDGVLICSRCYDRLRRRLEVAPDLIAHLRVLADPLKAFDYTRVRVQTSASEGSPAPVPADLLDACRDIMHAIQGGQLDPGAASDAAYRQALGAVGYLLAHYDELANDGDTILAWWRLVMSFELPEDPEFWTITKALSRWPLDDRRKWAQQPCPECGTRSVKITPPRHRHARTWLDCANCGWRKTETDDDGLWAAMFGLYADHYDDSNMTTEQKEIEMAERKSTTGAEGMDFGEAFKAGVDFALAHATETDPASPSGPFAAFMVGALPLIGEEFAKAAERSAVVTRRLYQNGDLMAGGMRLVAKAIRESVTPESAEAISA